MSKKGNRKARGVDLLNAAVADELAAVHQCMYFLALQAPGGAEGAAASEE